MQSKYSYMYLIFILEISIFWIKETIAITYLTLLNVPLYVSVITYCENGKIESSSNLPVRYPHQGGSTY